MLIQLLCAAERITTSGETGWRGSASDVADVGMLDDSRYLVSPVNNPEGSLLELALGMPERLPVGRVALRVRMQRMLQGKPCGTGIAAVTVAVLCGEELLAAEAWMPGGSWVDAWLHFDAPAAEDWEKLRVQLLVAPGERQIGISRVVLEGRLSDAPLPAKSQEPEAAAAEEAGAACVVAAADLVAEPVDPDAVAAAAADAAAGDDPPSPLITAEKAAEYAAEEKPQGKRKRARHRDGTYRGDDPATEGVNEAWQQS